MKRNGTAAWARNVFVLVMALMLCTGVFAVSAAADPLKPDDVTSTDGNITLHKQAERIGPEEWKVTVSADVKNIEVEPPKLEVVFVLDVSSTMNACAVMDQHNSYFNGGGYSHIHTANCPADCTATMHVHVAGSPSSICYKMGGANGTVYYPRRIEVAKEAIKSLVGDFPEGTIVKYAYFSTNAGTIDSYDKLGQYDIQGQTYIMKGVDLGISQFSDNDTSKVLVLVTDGEATDHLYTSTAFESFDGMVFTVGFNHEDTNLGEMAKNGGDYFTASNPGELTEAFEEISAKITTMVVDPMGPKVNFDVTGTTPTNGSISTVGSTIYWTPDDNQKLVGKVVEYSYTVKLKDETDRKTTTYTTDLNNPTSFRYGIEQNGVTDMTELNFPIPKATYAYSSVQVHWVDENEVPLIAPTEVERIVSDYGTPAYLTDYKTITPTIDIPDGDGAYYQYVKTTYKANGDEATGVNPANAVAHEVVHHYVRVEPPKVGNLELEKVIPDANATMREDSFTFAVKGPDGFTDSVSYTVNGTEKTGTVGADGVLTLTDVKANYVILLKDVPVGDYAVTETAKAGNTLFYDATYSNEGKATVEKDKTASLTVTNKPTETVFTKEWDDEGNRYGLRPTADDFVKKLLVLSGESNLQPGCKADDFTVEDKAVIVIRTNVEGLETNAWHVVALGLPKLETGYSYYLAEMDVEPYEAKDIILTADFTYTRDKEPNTHSFNVFAESTENKVLNYLGTTVNATVTKVWDDKDDQDGLRPGSLLVTLSNGQTETLSAANNWTATVNGLPKYNENGQEITYTWTEGELPEGYELTSTSKEGTVTTLTNTHTPELTSATVTKVWAGDADYAFFTRPDIVTVKLLANGFNIN